MIRAFSSRIDNMACCTARSIISRWFVVLGLDGASLRTPSDSISREGSTASTDWVVSLRVVGAIVRSISGYFGTVDDSSVGNAAGFRGADGVDEGGTSIVVFGVVGTGSDAVSPGRV